jgi:hypothetical protein
MARIQPLLYAAGLLAGLSLSLGPVSGCGEADKADAAKKTDNSAAAKTPAAGAKGAPKGGPDGAPKGGDAAAGGAKDHKGGVAGDPAAGPGAGGGPNGAGVDKPGPDQRGGQDAPAPPSFADLIADGDSITISVTVVGAEESQVDFQMLDKKDGKVAPRVLHVEHVVGAGPHKIAAPANLDGDLYVSVMSQGDEPKDEVGEPPPASGPENRTGGLAKPITLAGADHSVTVTVGTVPAWLDDLITPRKEGGGPVGGPDDGPQGGPGIRPPGKSIGGPATKGDGPPPE